MSALPPIATGSPQCGDRRYWPIGDIDCIYSIASSAVASNVCGMIATLPVCATNGISPLPACLLPKLA